MKILFAVFFSVIAALVVLAGCKTSRKGYESAPYSVGMRDGKFELRDYPTLTLVETRMSDGSGSSFQRLFRYISGNNQNEQKIAMTTPVLMAGNQTQRLMSFVMPADMKSAPTPRDSEVRCTTIPAGRFAVLGFSGSQSSDAEAEASIQLLAWMKSKSLEPSGNAIFGYFDPPWTPPSLRRNEAMIRVKE